MPPFPIPREKKTKLSAQSNSLGQIGSCSVPAAFSPNEKLAMITDQVKLVGVMPREGNDRAPLLLVQWAKSSIYHKLLIEGSSRKSSHVLQKKEEEEKDLMKTFARFLPV